MLRNIINSNIQNAQDSLVIQDRVNVIEEKFIINELRLM